MTCSTMYRNEMESWRVESLSSGPGSDRTLGGQRQLLVERGPKPCIKFYVAV